MGKSNHHDYRERVSECGTVAVYQHNMRITSDHAFYDSIGARKNTTLQLLVIRITEQ